MTEHNKLQIMVCVMGVSVLLLGLGGLKAKSRYSALRDRVEVLEARPSAVASVYRCDEHSDDLVLPIARGWTGPAYDTVGMDPCLDKRAPWCAPDCEWVE